MGVGFLVDGEEVLAFGGEEGGVVGRVYCLEGDGEGKAFCEDGVAGLDEVAGDGGFVFADEGLHGLGEALEAEEVAGAEVGEDV